MQMQERRTQASNGWTMLVGLFVAGMAIGYGFFQSARVENVFASVACGLLACLWAVMLAGFFTLQPNIAAVLTLFGKYVGTVVESGFHWANPLFGKKRVSLRAHNLNGEKIKVNDLRGSPIEIAAIIVWRVTDTAKAVFDVENYDSFVSIQSEAALRHMAMSYPYDTFEGDQTSLRGSVNEVSATLQKEVQERIAQAGVTIQEARISHLAYAPEIAGAMLQRQQAEAVVAARTRIVDGAVGMVELALEKLEARKTVTLDEERKAAMVSNLLVVLCSHEPPQPIVNAGTLYSG